MPSITGYLLGISIHALLAESDAASTGPVKYNREFLSTLSLRRATAGLFFFFFVVSLFLSTLSLRRATGFSAGRESDTEEFLSTLSLRRATPRGDSCYLDNIISIHALLAESDYDTSSLTQCQVKFLSTLSLRRATLDAWQPCDVCRISIHALLAESDLTA